uniref:calcineurin-like phosphoesterase C-terminal domain-containing protein n=1 Tax=Alistipes shahii TaxID=328814 RepID=UPI003FEFED6D
MGNHDMKLWGRSHETSAAAFEAMYGPAYYSYNVGEVHYAVLNDNYYIGRDWYYIGYLEERQLAWLERDLSFVPAGTTVVVALHIPTAFAGKDEKPFDYPQAERSLCNHRALHRLLEPYDAHIVSGHMHTTTNCPVREGLYEHNVAALSGAWWQGAICTDGTPAGYAVFEVDGGEVTWYYKSVGHPRSFQLKIYDSKDDEAFAGRVVANVWNCDPAWTVEMHADGGRPVRMERTTAVDPQARRLYADASKLDHKWITVTPSDHYYAAPLPAGTRRVEVMARDRFGNTYRAEKRINR